MARQFRMDSESGAWEIACHGAFGVAVAKAREQVERSIEEATLIGAPRDCDVAGHGRVARLIERLPVVRLGFDPRFDGGREPACI